MTLDDLDKIEAAYAKATDVCLHARSVGIPELHRAAPELFALSREALARREGATAFQAICAGLAKEAIDVRLLASGGQFQAFLYWDGRMLAYSGRHETEVAAVQAAIAEMERVKA